MALTTTVLVSGITNLSDARYVSGMGAELLSFPIDPSLGEALSAQSFKEIVSWVSGPMIAVETNDAALLENSGFEADFVHTSSFSLLQSLPEGAPVIFSLQMGASPEAKTLKEEAAKIFSQANVAYLLLESEAETVSDEILECVADLSGMGKILLGYGLANAPIDEILQKGKPAGIGLKGGKEIKPGYKDFDGLSEVLEALEAE